LGEDPYPDPDPDLYQNGKLDPDPDPQHYKNLLVLKITSFCVQRHFIGKNLDAMYKYGFINSNLHKYCTCTIPGTGRRSHIDKLPHISKMAGNF
jgi:hypothetical protein